MTTRHTNRWSVARSAAVLHDDARARSDSAVNYVTSRGPMRQVPVRYEVDRDADVMSEL